LTDAAAPGRTTSVTLAVETSGLSRRYGRRWALADVSLEIPTGSVTMLAGRNGSGKSTLLRVLATALRPDHGEARVLGHDVRQARDAVRRKVALLAHQSFLYEALTARENLRVAASFLGRDPSSALLADDPVASFSAGMRKRLSLARVLLQQAELVLLDEPYGELDPPGFALLDGVIGELRQRGATVVMATHLIDRGRLLCDRALLLEEGRLVWSGPAREMPAEAPGGSAPA
jgi:heme exporter protein A